MPAYSDLMSKINTDALREMVKLMRDPTLISFTAANPASESIDVDFVASLTADLFKNVGLELLVYGVSNGYAPLRESIAKILLPKRGLDVGPENILPITGAKQGLDVVAKTYINPGDVVLAENATFTGALGVFRTYGATCKAVPMDDKGIIIEALEEQVKKYRPKVLYTIPTFQNPTGVTLPADRRKAIADMAEKYDFIVCEDDPYCELRYSGEEVPTIKSFDKCGNVIMISTFSKILSPGIRVGATVADPEITNKLVVAKQNADATSPTLTQAIADAFLRSGRMDEHLAKVREVHKVRRDAMLAAIDEFFPEGIRYTKPDGGLFIWVELPGHPDVPAIQKRAIQEAKVAFMPGQIFCLEEGTGLNTMRLNFSSCKPEDIPVGIERLGNILKSL